MVWIKLGITNINSIKSAKQELDKQLDILINNAGIRGEVPQPASKVPIDRLWRVFETNFFGAVQTTQEFMDLLKKQTNRELQM